VSPPSQTRYRNSDRQRYSGSGDYDRYRDSGSGDYDRYRDSGSGDYNRFRDSSSGDYNRYRHDGGQEHSHHYDDYRDDDRRHYSGSHSNRYQYSGNLGSGDRYSSSEDRRQYSDDNKHEIVLHLNLFSRRPSQYGGRDTHSSNRRLSLDIPLRRNQLTPQLLYDAILRGQWRRPDDQPHFEYLQEKAATRDKVGIELFPIEEAPKILAALESKLFEHPPPVLDVRSTAPPLPADLPQYGGGQHSGLEEDDHFESEPQASGEQPRWSTVNLVNDLTEGYLRPDQVTRPPVTSRPPAAARPSVTYEPLPTPLSSRRLPLPLPPVGAGDRTVDGASFRDDARDLGDDSAPARDLGDDSTPGVSAVSHDDVKAAEDITDHWSDDFSLMAEE